MMKRIAGFFRRLFQSKGFRRGILALAVAFGAYYLYNMYLFWRVMRDSGLFTSEGIISIILRTPLIDQGRYLIPTPIGIGIIIGVVWFFYRKGKTNKAEEPEDEAEEPEDKTEEPAETKQEEEYIEPPQHRYH